MYVGVRFLFEAKNVRKSFDISGDACGACDRFSVYIYYSLAIL